jgi:predicted nuclease with TOPRIM domain
MNDLTLNITDLKAKIEKLVKLHQELKKENEQLAAAKKELEGKIEEQKVTIEALQKSNQEIEQSKSEEQNKIVTDTKDKINELVQEIDNCIALLK